MLTIHLISNIMCYNPITIYNKSFISHPTLSPLSFQVPCGRCDACRDARKTSWEDRLSLEVSDWYKNGGIGVMLTFTYNDSCLPWYHHDDIHIQAFSSSDILTLLNRIKVKSYRLFGPGFYRYFVCSEFGKTTHRPHYHVSFLIRDASRYVEFCEMCRECWCWTYITDDKGVKRPGASLGFMFPKYDGTSYVDDKGRNKDPRFRSIKAGAKYVCKYICKDLDYYSLPDVQRAEKFKSFDSYRPKSWKSNNLGFSAVARVVSNGSDEDIKKLLTLGIWCDITNRYVKLWDSAISRLMYNNVFNGRVSRLTGKKLYDRELSDFGRQYLWFSFQQRVARTALKMYQRFTLVQSSETLRFLFPIPNNHKFLYLSDFSKHALYHCLVKQYSLSQIALILHSQSIDFEDINNILNIETWRIPYILRHDSVSLSDCNYPYHIDSSLLDSLCSSLASLLEPYSCFDDIYSKLSIYLERCNITEYKKRGDSIHRAKLSAGVYSFPLNLC